jgi:hypothetical protein
MDDNNRTRFELAVALGPLARMRLRAEILLERASNGELPLTDAQHDALDRIAVAPTAADMPFLASFDPFIADE